MSDVRRTRVTVGAGSQNGSFATEAKDTLADLQKRVNSVFVQPGPFGLNIGTWLVIGMGAVIVLLLIAYFRK